MPAIKQYPKMIDGDIAVDQDRINGWFMTFNPDDDRFYVSANDDGIATATFRHWRNATNYARTHKVAA